MHADLAATTSRHLAMAVAVRGAAFLALTSLASVPTATGLATGLQALRAPAHRLFPGRRTDEQLVLSSESVFASAALHPPPDGEALPSQRLPSPSQLLPAWLTLKNLKRRLSARTVHFENNV